MTSIFADSAGTVSNTKERVIVFAALIASDSQIRQIDERCNRLKNKVAEWGVDTSYKKFEFHAYEIMQGSGIWRNLSEEKRIEVGKALRRAILIPKLHFAIVLIDKLDNGLQGIAKFSEDNDRIFTQVLANLREEERHGLESLIKKLPKKKGFGRLGDITGVLFGLTSGLMHAEGFRGSAKLIVDRQFIKQVEGWELVFRIYERSWPIVAKLGLLPFWPQNNQPDWHLGNTIDEIESYDSYGVQLADFITYMTRRIREEPLGLARQLAVANEHFEVPFTGYRGIYLITSYRPRRKFIYRREIKRRR
jgi:Protein of unknown function (DUF3800)